MSDDPAQRVPPLVRRIYGLVAELEALFPGRRFTPDGHMVGSLGEVLAAYVFGLKLLANSTEKHDARAPDGRLVQVKATQGKRVALSSEPEHLIVLRIGPGGYPSEVYNGPGRLAWNASGKVQKNGQRPVSVAALAKLMESVPAESRVPAINRVVEA